MTQTRMPARIAGAVAAIAGLFVLVLALAPATAGAATIEIKGKTERKLKFVGGETVEAGENLKIVNSTSPKKVGPHTFTLLEKQLIPKNEAEGEECYGPDGICQDIFIAHEIDEEEETIGRPNIDVGKKGWDRPFTNKETGDSWFTFGKGETEKRKVKAKAGTKLSYFCVIHPYMAGTVKVK